MTVLENEFYQTMINEMKKLNENLSKISETLKTLTIEVHENGGK